MIKRDCQWGKLTSLLSHVESLDLVNNPSILEIQHHHQDKNSVDAQCQIYLEKDEASIKYTGDITVYVEDHILEENKGFKIQSGERIVILAKHKEKIGEYIFSANLAWTQKGFPKEKFEEQDEGVLSIEKSRTLQEDIENILRCALCCKIIYECTTTVPCLHSFCMDCLMQHLRNSQDCPLCGERLENFRKDTSLNYVLEAFQESGYRRDRTQEECTEIKEKLKTESVVARFEYANGESYQGEWKKCRKDGRGKMVYKTQIYEGEWKNNMREGYGKMTYNGGAIYEGSWKNNMREGYGKMIYNDGTIYEGDWKKSKREGKGKMIFTNGKIYEGDWKSNRKEGQGKMLYANGAIYEGGWENDQGEGRGKMIFASGNIYDGNWVKSERQGYGTILYKNGDFYEGQWGSNRKHGHGKMTYSDGIVYEGAWRQDNREGSGKLFFQNGNIFEGNWIDDTESDYGKLTYQNGDIYEGYWKDGLREGLGRMIHADGAIFEGYWKADMKEGKGKFRYVNGNVVEGNWRENKREGYGSIKFGSGAFHEGIWKDDKIDGKERIINSNGLNIVIIRRKGIPLMVLPWGLINLLNRNTFSATFAFDNQYQIFLYYY